MPKHKQTIAAIAAAIIAIGSPAAAQSRFWQAPPIYVYPTEPPPPPPLVQFGAVLGAIATLPFSIIGAIAQPPAPVCYDPVTGQLFPCAPAMPVPAYTPPEPYPTPSYYQPRGPRKGYDPPATGGCYSREGNYVGGPDCRG